MAANVEIENIYLDNELSGCENVFRVGDKTLHNITSTLQEVVTPEIERMQAYKEAVAVAVADIRSREEADRIAAEQAAAAAAAKEKDGFSGFCDAYNDAYNRAIQSGSDLSAAVGAGLGAGIADLID